MKITLEQYDYTYTVETPYDDLQADAAMQMMIDLLKAAGYPMDDNDVEI
jgi:hypothetical protein